MAKEISDKTTALIIAGACIAAILIFHFAWSIALFQNVKNPVFTIVDGLLLGLFVAEAIGMYRYADDPNKDWKRKFVWVLALIICIWAGGWAAGFNERIL